MAQATSPPSVDPPRLRVFVDCSSCDFDYVRQQVTFVDYVRDRLLAQVHVLITRQSTGAGGGEYTLTFIGREAFVGVDDVLRYTSTPIATPDEVRVGYTRLLTMGLVRYLSRGTQAVRFDVRVSPSIEGPSPPSTTDRWNYWVFRIGVSGDQSGEELSRSTNISTFASARRITEAWKVRVALNGRYDSQRFELDEGDFASTSRSSSVDGVVVKSVGDHWGVGFGGSAISSTFLNQRQSFRIAPAFEYNLYPYRESTRRQFTFSYAVGVTSLGYREETIFDRTDETRLDGRSLVSVGFNQPWGTIDVSVEASQFLDEPSQYRVVAFGTSEYRIGKGLSLDLRGGSSLIRDQIYLAKRGASDEEVLLRRRQLATGFDYNISIGLTYTFGSIHDSVVNPRFAGASGQFIRLF